MCEPEHELSADCWCEPEVISYRDEPAEPVVHLVEAHLIAVPA